MARTVINPVLSFRTGSYQGNGQDGRRIECGFSPALVLIKGASTTYAVFRTSSHTGDDSSYISNAVSNLADAIQSFFTKGFTIGTDASVNTSGATYHYIAFAPSPFIKVGTYTGNGADNRSITDVGFTPAFILIKRNGISLATFRDSLDVGDLSHLPTAALDAANLIQALEGDGFQVGTADAVNANGQAYYYFAFKAASNLSISTFTGDGLDDKEVTGLGINPTVAFVKRSGSSVIMRTNTMIGDLSCTLANSAVATNLIQDLITDGIEVGSNTSVNTDQSAHHVIALVTARMRTVI